MIKAIYEKLTPMVKDRKWDGCLLSPLLFSIALEVQTRATRQEKKKERKGIHESNDGQK